MYNAGSLYRSTEYTLYDLHGAKLVLQKCQISNLLYQILDFILFPLPDYTVLAIVGGAGGGALLLVVITGVLLCALVIRKVRHTATKSQSELYTLWVFSVILSINLCTRINYDSMSNITRSH